ncbi:hypothetical protein ACI6PS_07910 [Flavobacterium sp. PLA-1-15]|uniref:hypothetical protein n=1 Tax=Flavobacterium sp. PLA-1-15 TaxID=3380533 RepID=UPI003B768C3C
MKKYSLTSELGQFFVLTSNVMGIGIMGFLLYSLLTLNWVALILCTFFAVMHFIKFFRNTIRFKNLYFDDEFVYYEEQKIPLNKILRIDEKKIVYDEMGHQGNLYFNYFFCEKIKLLNERHMSAIRSK